MVEPADVDAAGGEALRLVLQRRPQRLGRLIPLGLVVDLEQVAVRVAEPEGRAVAKLVLVPALRQAGRLECGDPAGERLRAARAERGVAEARTCARR